MAEKSSAKIFINPEDYAKLFHWAKLAISPDSKRPVEIGGYGCFDPGKMLVYGLVLVEQTVGSGDVDFDMTGLAPYLAVSKHPEHWIVWWHSHGSINVHVSGTDQSHIDDWGKTIDHLISIVVNFNGDSLCRVDYFRPVRCHLDVDLVPFFELDDKVKDQMAKEVAKKVKFRKDIPVVQGNLLPGFAGTTHYLGSSTLSSVLDRKLPKSLKKKLRKMGIASNVDILDLIDQDALMAEIFGPDFAIFKQLDEFLKRSAVHSYIVGRSFKEFTDLWNIKVVDGFVITKRFSTDTHDPLRQMEDYSE